MMLGTLDPTLSDVLDGHILKESQIYSIAKFLRFCNAEKTNSP